MNKLIIANWKMHLNIAESSLLLHKLEKFITVPKDVEVALAPNMLALQSVSLQLRHHRKFKLAAQNCFWRDDGPYTGEVSANMLRGLVHYVLVGHSERRHTFGETDTLIRHKVQAVVRNRMQPVLCVGETAREKADGDTHFVLQDQVVAGLSNITSEEADQIVIAYEPVWALSNGKDFATHPTPSPDDAAEAAAFIRKHVAYLFGEAAAKKIRILYGGSVNDQNARGFMKAKGIDGLLVGGASLNVHNFANIVHLARSEKT
ncbi:MAG TPA: triose-phosphate isomerase [Candidatus Saccharimonadales bacterium]